MEQIEENNLSPIDQIMFLRQQVVQRGGNHDEVNRLDQIIEALKTGRLNPEEAIKQASSISEEKYSPDFE